MCGERRINLQRNGEPCDLGKGQPIAGSPLGGDCRDMRLVEGKGYFISQGCFMCLQHSSNSQLSARRIVFFTGVQERHHSHWILCSLLQVRKCSSDGSFYACSFHILSAQKDPSAISAHLGWHLLISYSLRKIHL